MLKKYRLCNPDVSFSYNQSWQCAAQGTAKRKETSYISWYDLPSFETLVTKLGLCQPRPGADLPSPKSTCRKSRRSELCERISQDLIIALFRKEEPLSWLNGLLTMPGLIDRCRTRKLAFPPSPEIETLDTLTYPTGERLRALKRGRKGLRCLAQPRAVGSPLSGRVPQSPSNHGKGLPGEQLFSGAEDREAPRGQRDDADGSRRQQGEDQLPFL